MPELREGISAIVGVLTVVFFVINGRRISTAVHLRLLLVAFGLLVASLICSVVEGLVWKESVNLLQHILASAGMVVLAIWSWRAFVRDEGVSV